MPSSADCASLLRTHAVVLCTQAVSTKLPGLQGPPVPPQHALAPAAHWCIALAARLLHIQVNTLWPWSVRGRSHKDVTCVCCPVGLSKPYLQAACSTEAFAQCFLVARVPRVRRCTHTITCTCCCCNSTQTSSSSQGGGCDPEKMVSAGQQLAALHANIAQQCSLVCSPARGRVDANSWVPFICRTCCACVREGPFASPAPGATGSGEGKCVHLTWG